MKKIPFNTPDLNAPRFRGQSTGTMKKSFYKEFIHKFPEHSNLDYTQFKRIVEVFHKTLVSDLTDQRGGIELPERLGVLLIANCSRGEGIAPGVNVKESVKRGYKVFYENWHSNHKLMKIFFSNKLSRFNLKDKKLWEFRLNKENRRTVSKAYEKKPSFFITVHHKENVSEVIQRESTTKYLSAKNKVVSEDYDEFNMD